MKILAKTSQQHDHAAEGGQAHSHPHTKEHIINARPVHVHEAVQSHDHVHENDHDPDHGHEHDHEHEHEHGNGHDHEHEHDHTGSSLWANLTHFFVPHSHTHYNSAQDAALASERGIWAVKISLFGLLVTAIFQVAIVMISGSVALLADTIHNFSDAMTAIPLWLAFALAKRASNRRFTYGYGRAEDISGVIVVLLIFASAVIAIYESLMKLAHPQPMSAMGWVAAASIVGFLGNELVAIFRIKVGKEIGSAALVADGLHARTDGITSLGVLAGVILVWLGFPIADPIVGILIGIAILAITVKAAIEVGSRILDAIDPEIVTTIEKTAQQVAGVIAIHDVTARWVGHRQRCELHIMVDPNLSTIESHRIAEEVRHGLFHQLPAMVGVTVHVDPMPVSGFDTHSITQHHFS